MQVLVKLNDCQPGISRHCLDLEPDSVFFHQLLKFDFHEVTETGILIMHSARSDDIEIPKQLFQF